MSTPNRKMSPKRKISNVMIHSSVSDTVTASRVKQVFDNVQPVDDKSIIPNYRDGKRVVAVTPKKGETMDVCATISDKYVCCNVQVLKSVSNCPFDCSYCFLQNYLNDGTTSIIGDVAAMMAEVRSKCDAEPKRLFRIGTWELGDSLALEAETGQAEQLIAEFATLDTAHFYAKGKSNQLLAPYLSQAPRSEWTIIGKGGLHWAGNSVHHDASFLALKEDLHRSLDSLNVDYLDHYLLHWPDSQTPLLDSCEALASFKQEGLIKSWGVCNVPLENISEDILLLRPDHYHLKMSPLSNNSSMAKLAAQLGLSVFGYSIFEQGLLTQSFDAMCISKSDWRRKNPHFNAKVCEQISQWQHKCAQSSVSLQHVVMAWIQSQRCLDGVVVGPRSKSQLEILLNYNFSQGLINVLEFF